MLIVDSEEYLLNFYYTWKSWCGSACFTPSAVEAETKIPRTSRQKRTLGNCCSSWCGPAGTLFRVLEQSCWKTYLSLCIWAFFCLRKCLSYWPVLKKNVSVFKKWYYFQYSVAYRIGCLFCIQAKTTSWNSSLLLSWQKQGEFHP